MKHQSKHETTKRTNQPKTKQPIKPMAQQQNPIKQSKPKTMNHIFFLRCLDQQ
jgi:hypothetical protein